MQGRRQSIMSVRLAIRVLVAVFVVSFVGVLVQYGGVWHWGRVFVRTAEEEIVEVLTFDGVVLSMNDERYQHTRNVLTSLGFKVSQKVPPSFESKEVDQGLEQYTGNRNYHTSAFKKVWSNRMAFTDAIEEFVQDSNSTSHTWRFFFEDDIAIHPSITAERGRVLLAKGVKLADKDGFVYLGICGPTCLEPRVLDADVQAAECAGTCAHAFGLQQWKAGEFLTEIGGLTFSGPEGPVVLGFFFDRFMFEYARQVKRIWLVGSNLKSPVGTVADHFGLIFQDRSVFHTSIGK